MISESAIILFGKLKGNEISQNKFRNFSTWMKFGPFKATFKILGNILKCKSF